MNTKIFVNLPVKNLTLSKEFFSKLGYTFNPQFTDDKAGCLVISEDIYAMLVTETFFKTFIPEYEIADATKTKEVLTALSFESKEKVDELMEKALSAGGKEPRPVQDLGFMYNRAFEDLDGHIWEPFWMDITKAPPTPQAKEDTNR